MVAAKKLQDLAQGYGSKENIGVLVVRLNTDQGPSLARLRQNRSMSIDDIEAAAQFEARRQQKLAETPPKQRASVGELDKVDGRENMTPTPPPPPPPPTPPFAQSSPADTEVDMSEAAAKDSGLSDEFARNNINAEFENSIPEDFPPPPPEVLPDLNPLPRQKFRKKNIASEWENILQKRLTDDVKDKELKQLGRSVSEESLFRGEGTMQPVTIDLDGSKRDMNIETRAVKREAGTLRKRLMTPPWYHQVENNPTASYGQIEEGRKPDDKRPKVRKTIAMFENMGKDEEASASNQRRTVVTLERDERTPLNGLDNVENTSSDLSMPKVDIQTLGGGKPELNGSVEGNLYPAVRKVSKPDQNHNSETALESPGEVTIVEIARL